MVERKTFDFKSVLMQKIKYIAAFTMMDILTGMVIMSIVIAMVFYLMTATNNQAFNYQKIRIELNDYMLLKADLKRRADLANRIEAVPNGFKLVSENDEITYLKSNSFLLRQTENSQDTLYRNLEKIELSPVDSEGIEIANPLISGVSLTLKFDQQILSCYLYKDYGLTEPINQSLKREF